MTIVFFVFLLLGCGSSWAQQVNAVACQEELAHLRGVVAQQKSALNALVEEKNALTLKVLSLQRLILDRDADTPRLMEQAQASCRLDMEQLKKDLSMAQLALVQSSERVGGVEKEKDTWQYQIDMLVGEKVALRQSLKLVADQLDLCNNDRDVLKQELQKQIKRTDDAASAAASDVEVRLAKEEAKVNEKISLAKKPLEEKISVMENSLKVKDALCQKEIANVRAVGEEKLKQREEQVAILRESAGREVKKVQDAAAMDIQKIQDQLTACRSERK